MGSGFTCTTTGLLAHSVQWIVGGRSGNAAEQKARDMRRPAGRSGADRGTEELTGHGLRGGPRPVRGPRAGQQGSPASLIYGRVVQGVPLQARRICWMKFTSPVPENSAP